MSSTVEFPPRRLCQHRDEAGKHLAHDRLRTGSRRFPFPGGEGEDARLVVADHPQPPGARDVERKPWRSRPRPAWTCSANVFMPRRMSVTPVASQTRHRPEPGSSPLQDRKNPRQRRSVNRTVDDHSRAACQGELLGHALARRPRREPAAPPRSRKPTIIVFASCVPLPSSIHFSRERPRCLKNNPMS